MEPFCGTMILKYHYIKILLCHDTRTQYVQHLIDISEPDMEPRVWNRDTKYYDISY